MERIVELVVRELYARAHLDMGEPHGAVRVATAILGAACVRLVAPRAIPGKAALAWSPRGAAMYIRTGLTRREVNHAAAHELAEWILRISGYAGPDVEEVADRIAAALCVPRPAFERARQHLGDSIQALSHCFAVSQSLGGSNGGVDRFYGRRWPKGDRQDRADMIYVRKWTTSKSFDRSGAC